MLCNWLKNLVPLPQLIRSKTKTRPSDRVRKKVENYAEIFGQIMQKESVDCVEKMPDYAEISKINQVVPSVFSNI